MKRLLALVLASAGVLLVSGCTDETGPGTSPIEILSASLLVNGEPVADGVRPTHGDMMHIQAQVTPGSLAMVQRVMVDHTSPPMVRGRSMHHEGVMMLYDDGTHGDHRPGDGLYCHEGDMIEMMRFMGQGMGMMQGEHKLEIYVEDGDGNHSEHYTLPMKIN
jgi:hypothetical protein